MTWFPVFIWKKFHILSQSLITSSLKYGDSLLNIFEVTDIILQTSYTRLNCVYSVKRVKILVPWSSAVPGPVDSVWDFKVYLLSAPLTHWRNHREHPVHLRHGVVRSLHYIMNSDVLFNTKMLKLPIPDLYALKLTLKSQYQNFWYISY